ncbi:hypothetical protein EP331_08445, partial [bacterium]
MVNGLPNKFSKPSPSLYDGAKGFEHAQSEASIVIKIRVLYDVGCRMSDVGCRMSDVGCRMSDVGCRMSD